MLLIIVKSCLKQNNGIDCGLFLLFNAESFGRGAEPLANGITGEKLRLRYLALCVEAHNRHQIDAGLESTIDGEPGHIRKRKRLQIVIEEEEREEDGDDEEMPDRKRQQAMTLDEVETSATMRETLTKYLTKCKPESYETKSLENTRAEAATLVAKMQAIGCVEVLNDWKRMKHDLKNDCGHEKWEYEPYKLPAAAIARLINQTTKRAFRDQVMLRIGQALLLRDINYRVTKLRSAGPSSKQFARMPPDPAQKGYTITRAYEAFMIEAHPKLTGSDRAELLERYRAWGREGQIWFHLYAQFGLPILFLVPAGHAHKKQKFFNSRYVLFYMSRLCILTASISYTRIPVWQHELFCKALWHFRPELKAIMSGMEIETSIVNTNLRKILFDNV